VKSGPDVFADALVPSAAAVDARRFSFSPKSFLRSLRCAPEKSVSVGMALVAYRLLRGLRCSHLVQHLGATSLAREGVNGIRPQQESVELAVAGTVHACLAGSRDHPVLQQMILIRLLAEQKQLLERRKKHVDRHSWAAFDPKCSFLAWPSSLSSPRGYARLLTVCAV